VWRFQTALLVVPAIALTYFALFAEGFPQHDSPVIGVRILGSVLCILGVAVAIWARVHLGENWGMPMAQIPFPRMVMSGPYAYVRHPIYTGVLLGMIGTMIATSPMMLVGWPLIAFVFFGISAIREERDMLRAFPEQYGEYMAHTKRLVPFVW
jgi:protein-S-isoprenylcysteine O-methyltransferase Ste14